MLIRSRLAPWALALLSACRCGGAASAGTFDVPRTVDAIVIDGQCTEKSWKSAFLSPLFADSHGATAPFTKLLATADDDTLFLAVYVADIDIESKGDEVRLEVGPLHLVVTPKGGTAPPGVRLAVDTDDTIDDPRDYDEEWVSEIAIPWSLLGTREVPVRAMRVDVGHGEPPHAMAWPPFAKAVLRFGNGNR